MTTPEQHAAGVVQVRGWLQRLVGGIDDPTTLLWHYTRGDSLIPMVKSGTMYATQVSCLNDSSEIRYAARLLQSALTDVLTGLEGGSHEECMVRRYVDLLADNDEIPNHAPNSFFVACFSELEDDLGMWRSYSGGENGYALGVRVEHFGNFENAIIGKVNYDRTQHESLAREVAEATVARYREIRTAQESVDDSFDSDFLIWWDGLISALAPFAKDPGFASEKEVRIAIPFDEKNYDQLVFLQKRTLLARHLPFSFPAGRNGDSLHLPISDLIVGPGRHKQISLVGANTLLRQCRYPEWLHGRRSRIPFQEV